MGKEARSGNVATMGGLHLDWALPCELRSPGNDAGIGRFARESACAFSPAYTNIIRCRFLLAGLADADFRMHPFGSCRLAGT